MDFVAAFSGFLVSASLLWMAFLLFAALIFGGLAASVFVSIFYAASRLATSAGRAYSDSASSASGEARAGIKDYLSAFGKSAFWAIKRPPK